jgi:hypothetical protein
VADPSTLTEKDIVRLQPRRPLVADPSTLTEKDIVRLQRELKRTRETLATLIGWMVQSSVSPINRDEAMQLLRKLDGDEE